MKAFNVVIDFDGMIWVEILLMLINYTLLNLIILVIPFSAIGIDAR